MSDGRMDILGGKADNKSWPQVAHIVESLHIHI